MSLVITDKMKIQIYEELSEFFVKKQNFEAAACMRDLVKNLQTLKPENWWAGVKDGKILLVHVQAHWIRQQYSPGYLDEIIPVLVTPGKSTE